MAASSPCYSIFILGTRGIPACYGGFETFAEELSTRLVEKGHQVTVFGRRGFLGKAASPREYKGVKLKYAPTIFHKYAETPIAALTSFLMVLFKAPDIILLCNAANSPFAWLARLRGIPVVVNVDGIERKRGKWNLWGRLWYRLGEWSSVKFGNRIIADANCIADYYRERYQIEPAIIRYGATPRLREPGEVLKKFGLEKNKYILYVSRLEPENNAKGVIEAYARVQTAMPLVIVGDAPYSTDYIAELRRIADKRVIFTGFQFNEAYHELRTNCYLYVQATEVGGTHPALVEAMAFGNCVVANDVPEHREVLMDCGLYYARNNFTQLAEILERLVSNPSDVGSLGEKARRHAQMEFSWEAICAQYEALFNQTLSKRLVGGSEGFPQIKEEEANTSSL